jgi:hypothetical protein
MPVQHRHERRRLSSEGKVSMQLRDMRIRRFVSDQPVSRQRQRFSNLTLP